MLSLVILFVSWAVWLGSVVFFSFVVAPTVHEVFERPEAARLLRRLFPRYYLFGAACGLVAVGAALVVRNDLRLTAPLVIAAVLSLYARQVLTPALERARNGDDDARFARLHASSVRLNLIALACLLLAGSVLTIL
jgi:hypothetical protein